ncbi:hypothetical protein TOPH_06645 [Tolypocladium ophioglossoides CBS 100239]|uniref:Low temperature requirement A n=1 Tax=Tolypocladium ophioglossoides (strain CBS 100239) TaxID=1163406 RepID=A0A0L0N3X1_TOLOC|nr:hypothetical protein TOPH_06645 [Tolypocladium ophioglossoides CBS 100239]
MADHHQHHLHVPDKLRIFKSPVVGPGGDKDLGLAHSPDDNREFRDGRDHDDDLPQFARYVEPTLLELFFDLFFAANYNVFSENQEVTNHARLLWLTWFLVTLYDVRYVTDSIFTRVTRAIQLGVLVGFAVVAPKFDPTNQHRATMRAMSLILAISRACLAVEYATTLWHVRKFKKARLPLYLQTAVHVVAAAIYLGITFRFQHGRSRVFMTWYFISGAEGVLTILLSNFSPVLSLTKTHLMKRMTLLTVMMLGDGIVQIAKEVVTIVKTPDVWNPVTIGLVTAAAATIYFVFLIYFDWLRSSLYLPAWRQQLWTSIHLPFHLSLVLFMQGFTQYLIWSKIVDVLSRVTMSVNQGDAELLANTTSKEVQDNFNQTVTSFFKLYPPKVQSTFDTVNDAIANFTQIPDSFWPDLVKYFKTNDENVFDGEDAKGIEIFINALTAVMQSMANALFANFGINLESEITTKNPTASSDIKGGGFQGRIQDKTWERYRLVFAYGYIASGCALFFMIMLSLIARTKPLKTWPIIRLVIIFLLALGLGLTATLWFNTDRCYEFLQTAWVLPTITFVWTVVLIITHINGEGIKRNAHRFKRRRQPYTSVSVPLTSTGDWASNDRKGAGGPGDVDAEAQRRAPSPRGSDDDTGAERYEGHQAEEIGVAYGGSDRPHSSYDPLEAPTEYKGASHA